MKILFLVTALWMHTTIPVIAQDTTKVTTYPLVISFQSICCGVPSDSTLKSFILSFKKKNKIKKIVAKHIGPMGREGEYKLAFPLKELTKKQATNFISKIKKIKPLPTENGKLSFEENSKMDPNSISRRATITDEIF
jgi:hypothetical protein